MAIQRRKSGENQPTINAMTGQAGVQRHLRLIDCDRSGRPSPNTSPISPAEARALPKTRRRRRWCGSATDPSSLAKGRPRATVLSAAPFRNPGGTRIWNQPRSGANPKARHAHRRGGEGHNKELVGMRHRHRVSLFGEPGAGRVGRGMTQSTTCSDPAHTVKKIRYFGLPGQQPGGKRSNGRL